LRDGRRIGRAGGTVYIDCFSNQFLLYLNTTVTRAAYRTWARLARESPSLFPPDRFNFQVVELPVV
jgi:hypothetical protein